MDSTAQIAIDNAAPIGYAINRGGPGGPGSSGGMDTKSQVWGLVTDWHSPNCILCVVRFLDGSPVLVRYHRRDVVLTSVRFTQMLDTDYRSNPCPII